jgi:hypothetical protein
MSAAKGGHGIGMMIFIFSQEPFGYKLSWIGMMPITSIRVYIVDSNHYILTTANGHTTDHRVTCSHARY